MLLTVREVADRLRASCSRACRDWSAGSLALMRCWPTHIARQSPDRAAR